jgi:hypothetical protein
MAAAGAPCGSAISGAAESPGRIAVPRPMSATIFSRHVITASAGNCSGWNVGKPFSRSTNAGPELLDNQCSDHSSLFDVKSVASGSV